MVFGPCGGVRSDGTCEVDPRPCPFDGLPGPVAWPSAPGRAGPPAAPTVGGSLLRAATRGPVVLTDLTPAPYDAAGLPELVALLAEGTDAVLVGEHQDQPDYPPSVMAALLREAGAAPWLTLACRDRNRLVLEQELAGLAAVGADGVLCVTGDARAPGVRPDVTQVFDLDSTRLAGLAAADGVAVAVAEAPSARPRDLRPGRLVEKQRAGAHLAVLNHVARPTDVAGFVAAARERGLTIPVLAAVAVVTDAPTARRLAAFPGLDLGDDRLRRVVAADDPRAAGIDAAVEEAHELLAVPGVVGVNLSGAGHHHDPRAGAEVKAEIATRTKELR